MNEKNITIIVSDLHVGGGPADPGDDHVYQGAQFHTWLEKLGATPEGKCGDVELFINGDFLEFAQVRPEVYQLGSSRYWCSAAESLQKLEAILTGHPDIFAALKHFQGLKNHVTIAAGNHDVDFWWPEVQERFWQDAGRVTFALGQTWYRRYDGRLLIGHGHLFDPANTFAHWSYPILIGPRGIRRLEMCPGTLFMVKFVNWLDHKYPFSDNIKPVTALGRILWQENRLGLAAVSWMLSRFLARHPSIALGVNPSDMSLGLRLKEMIEYDDTFATGVTRLYQQTREPYATIETVRGVLDSEEALSDFLYDLLPKVPPEEWLPIFDQAGESVRLAIDSHGRTLKILQAGKSKDKEILRQEAEKALAQDDGPQVVVMGHTHQPDELRTEHGIYFNPGSWTRYVDLEKAGNLRLVDLQREDDFPYQLNYVRVEQLATNSLKAEMICYDQG